MKYAIWNNKGGVGKTFLSFIIGTEYARLHQEKNVILVDMCPQANLSEIILGGNGNGGKALSNLLSRGKSRRTIGGYFDYRIQIPSNLVGVESEYLINVEKINKNLPKNLYLICGDPSLEFQGQVINQISSQSAPQGIWRNVRLWLNNLVSACSTKLGDESVTVIIDCNPSFSSYTEIAVSTADRLIMPCSSDGSSARAIDNVSGLLYGFNTPEDYKQSNFASKAAEHNMAFPLINAVILNRSTQYGGEASNAFKAMFREIKDRVNRFKKSSPNKFVKGEDLFFEMPDTHQIAIACSHTGRPLHKIEAKSYRIHNKTIKVNDDQLDRYSSATEKLLEIID
uniref:CobQ/CobB/MinD/ParA nucleotide binding domain-containing protein n=1 Tax=Candidatus Kentrum sp. TUN TaxID=2126343 RepID=A0A450ZCH3_9GAMM|nr:MAG: CobQ/CobB/MinD/ParA nucleotide binding domain-containing protein [Candidatus Kentron sp. TUN]VFK51482.1 MAG: CobQ/CobB/MinD/ParA nucleotide binding domain-containing protein [Candidatus Kentron sp. TUN]VFK59472.1 MAG: CobQ/CobB/MinD/ParA nucleotide binding domain-containing protein [Candidatus Kentron sp. TUN]